MQVESDLRAISAHPDAYTPDGHLDRIANCATVMQGELLHWMRERPPVVGEDRRQGDRRHTEERRQQERRSTTKPGEAA